MQLISGTTIKQRVRMDSKQGCVCIDGPTSAQLEAKSACTVYSHLGYERVIKCALNKLVITTNEPNGGKAWGWKRCQLSAVGGLTN